jgi:hypothetical protein
LGRLVDGGEWHGVSGQTIYVWRSRFATFQADDGHE